MKTQNDTVTTNNKQGEVCRYKQHWHQPASAVEPKEQTTLGKCRDMCKITRQPIPALIILEMLSRATIVGQHVFKTGEVG